MPRSILLGRTPKDGEAWFGRGDTEGALALHAFEAGTHSCGQPVDEAFDVANADGYAAEALICHACAARDRESKSWAKDAAKERADLSGLHLTVKKRDDL